MEKYYLIHNPDGDTTIDELTKKELIDRVGEDYYGENGYLDKMPDDNDTNYWRCKILIIKGKIVTPTPKEIVTTYEFE